MENNKASVMERVHPELFMSPHVADKLVDLIKGDLKPDASQLEQLIAHLTECYACREALIEFLSQEEENEKPSSDAEIMHNLLSQLVTLHHNLKAQNLAFLKNNEKTD